MICTQSAAIVPGHAGDGLSEMFTFVSYSRGFLGGARDPCETAAHLPLAPLSLWGSGTESSAHSGPRPRAKLSFNAAIVIKPHLPPPLAARPHGNSGLRLPPPPYPRPPSCGPEAARAGGLWEEAGSDGAASARDGEAAAGPEPEVSGARGQGSRRGRGSGRSGRRLGRARRGPRRKGGGGGGGGDGLPHFGASAEPPASASSPACAPLPHRPVLFHCEALAARGGFWESLEPRWDPVALAHGLLGFVVPPGAVLCGWVFWGLGGPSR